MLKVLKGEETAMVHPDEVSRQLRRMKAGSLFWCRAEVRELPKILFDGEQLEHLVVGQYEGGFALLVATDRRVLLIDKKPFYLTLEDIRYDMISDVQFNHRLVDATIRLGTVHKTISFTGYNHHKMREFTAHVQERVMVYRQAAVAQSQPQPAVSDPLQSSPVVQQMFSEQPQPAQPERLKAAINPYTSPVIIRRRVSRFF